MKKLFLIASLFISNYLFSADTYILMARHGQTDWNLHHRVQGHSDIPLNATGQAQAKALAEKMMVEHPDISAIYSSDLDRAYATALETAKKFGLTIEKRASIREIFCGVSEGQYSKDAKAQYGEHEKILDAKYPDRKERWKHTAIPECETEHELLQRTKNEIIALGKAHEGEKIAVYSHGGAIGTLILDILDSDDNVNLNNCDVAHFIYSKETDTLTFVKIEPLLP